MSNAYATGLKVQFYSQFNVIHLTPLTRHNNIGTFFDSISDDGSDFFVMMQEISLTTEGIIYRPLVNGTLCDIIVSWLCTLKGVL